MINYTRYDRIKYLSFIFVLTFILPVQAVTGVTEVIINNGGSAENILWLVVSALVILLIVLTAWGYLFKNKAGEFQLHAFGLPPGTIRAILALSLVFTFMGLSFYFTIGSPSINTEQAAVADKVFIAVSTALTTVLGFYFGSGGAKQAMSDLSKALDKQDAANPDNSVIATAEKAVKTAEAATERAKISLQKLVAKEQTIKSNMQISDTEKKKMLIRWKVSFKAAEEANTKAIKSYGKAMTLAAEITLLSQRLSKITDTGKRDGLASQCADKTKILMEYVAATISRANKIAKFANTFAVA